MTDTVESLKAQLARVEAVLRDLLGEQRSAATPSWLLDEMVAWVRHAETMHTFLQGSFEHEGEYSSRECALCGGYTMSDTGVVDHNLSCELLLLWEKIDPERYQKTMDAMFERWCADVERRERMSFQRQRSDFAQLNLYASQYAKEGQAFLLASRSLCTCAGGSPRAAEYTDPHVESCPLSRPVGIVDEPLYQFPKQVIGTFDDGLPDVAHVNGVDTENTKK